MKKTIFSHFYNEEYLLPWWLMHHREIFDHGVMINYASTDSSVDIIRELCPNWEIVDSVNPDFDAKRIEPEVQSYEAQHEGWKIVMNTTEFYIGNPSLLNDPNINQFTFRCHVMVDSVEDEGKEPDRNVSLLKQRTNGINTHEPWASGYKRVRHCRTMHRIPGFKYSLGRHYHEENTDDMHVLWYGFSPFTQKLLERKLQIKTRIPEHNVKRRLGFEHMYPEEKMISEMKRFQRDAKDMSKLISKYVK